MGEAATLVSKSDSTGFETARELTVDPRYAQYLTGCSLQ